MKLNNINNRPSWHEYFMRIAMLAATRSTCLRRQVGAVIVKDKKVLATGYNGSPSGLKHCLEVGCMREEMGIPSGQRHELCGGTLYSTTFPCILCAKMLINAQIKEIYIAEGYPDDLSREMLDEAGITIHRLTIKNVDLSDINVKDMIK